MLMKVPSEGVRFTGLNSTSGCAAETVTVRLGVKPHKTIGCFGLHRQTHAILDPAGLAQP